MYNSSNLPNPFAPIIEVRNLVKWFKSWESRPSRQLKTVLISFLKMNFSKSKYQTVSVLDGVSFSVKPGDFLGIMGRNGIGKSTILKLISGIYQPTEGSIEIRGRVIPLLELGAGFDSELTGYENIFLNASILGFSKDSVEKALDQIIEFSGLGSKIHLLTRNYSSGMLVRLGFSIAVHMDYDILLLDEVLGVGDAGFVEKSIKKIQDLNKLGKTVILVTHHPEQVIAFCSRCIVLHEKKVAFDGTPKEGIEVYKKIFSSN
jgi:ABC-type polysaccharide/polyol phosphate transport system ATPase subunit